MKPMISPGSTHMRLVDKTDYSYFMRSISNDQQQVSALAFFVDEYGWQNVGIISSRYFTQHELPQFKDELRQVSVNVVSEVALPHTSDEGYSRYQMELPLNLMKASGARIIIALVRTDDMAEVLAVVRELGLLASGYAWIGLTVTFTSAMLAADSGLPGYLYVQATASSPTARRIAFDAAWPGVSRRYNQTVDGAFNPSTGEPFFGSDVHSATIWDTDYAPFGDGLSDFWGNYVYGECEVVLKRSAVDGTPTEPNHAPHLHTDTVWLFAEALANITSRRLDPSDGTALRDQLLMSDFEGITGRIQFDPDSQDRREVFELVNVQVTTS